MKYFAFFFFAFAVFHFTTPAQPVTTTVYFDYNRYELSPEARARLSAVLKPGIPADSFSVAAHCDSIGSHGYNDVLSQNRVAAVTAWLDSTFGRRAGVLSRGFGKRLPVTDNSTAELRQMNRRAEVIIYYPSPPVDAGKPVPPKSAPESGLKTAVEQAAVGGRNIILKNIEFEGGRHFFLPHARPALEELLRTMRELPELEIEIQGHICCQPGPGDGMDLDTYTANLSVNRARAVYDYLKSNGIAANRMRYAGFGHQFPITAERTEAEKTTNRRVEIKILKK